MIITRSPTVAMGFIKAGFQIWVKRTKGSTNVKQEHNLKKIELHEHGDHRAGFYILFDLNKSKISILNKFQMTKLNINSKKLTVRQYVKRHCHVVIFINSYFFICQILLGICYHKKSCQTYSSIMACRTPVEPSQDVNRY